MVEKEATPEKPRQMGNREKMRRKEENWEVFFINRITIIYIIYNHQTNKLKMSTIPNP